MPGGFDNGAGAEYGGGGPGGYDGGGSFGSPGSGGYGGRGGRGSGRGGGPPPRNTEGGFYDVRTMLQALGKWPMHQSRGGLLLWMLRPGNVCKC